MDKKSKKRLSRNIASALRHAPEEYGLTMDEHGWVDVDDLLVALRQRREQWAALQAPDLEYLVTDAGKKRFEIADGRIRAYFGHSIPVRIDQAPGEPPEPLYHGTNSHAADAILKDGLKRMNRLYVHLTTDLQIAQEVGSRHEGETVILQIEAKKAFAAGIAFYHGHESVWLADDIPAMYIGLVDGKN